jgi:hypothetical protein
VEQPVGFLRHQTLHSEEAEVVETAIILDQQLMQLEHLVEAEVVVEKDKPWIPSTAH